MKKRNFEKKREREEIEVSVLLLIKITGNTRKLLSINETLNPLIKEESRGPLQPIPVKSLSISLSVEQKKRKSGEKRGEERRRDL